MNMKNVQEKLVNGIFKHYLSDFTTNRQSRGGGTCGEADANMYELLCAGMNWYDVTNKGSRLAGTSGTQSDHGTLKGS